jgi:hypothetical protein
MLSHIQNALQPIATTNHARQIVLLTSSFFQREIVDTVWRAKRERPSLGGAYSPARRCASLIREQRRAALCIYGRVPGICRWTEGGCPNVLSSAAIAIPQLPRHHDGTTHVWSFPLQVAIAVGMAAARFECLPLGEFDELVKTPKAMGTYPANRARD